MVLEQTVLRGYPAQTREPPTGPFYVILELAWCADTCLIPRRRRPEL